MKETFKDITDFEGSYQIDKQGNIKSIKFPEHRILKERINGSGYSIANLSKDKKNKNYYVHLLMARTFLDCYKVTWKNNIKTDNRLINLIKL